MEPPARCATAQPVRPTATKSLKPTLRSNRTTTAPRTIAALAADPDVARWNGQSLSSGQLAKVYGFKDLDGSQPDAWAFITEVWEGGKQADVSDYR